MDFISMILFSVVFLAQITLFVLFFWEKRHNNRRYSALLQYIERRINDVDCREEIEKHVDERVDAFKKKIDMRFADQDELYTERHIRQNDAIMNFRNTVSEKLDSMMLDYSQAQEAASKVNEFASGLASIFDYDPIEALKKGRNREAS